MADSSGERPWWPLTFSRSWRRDALRDSSGTARRGVHSPDSCGAAGPNHFVEVVNRNFAVYNKSTGEELINILLGAFLPEQYDCIIDTCVLKIS